MHYSFKSYEQTQKNILKVVIFFIFQKCLLYLRKFAKNVLYSLDLILEERLFILFWLNSTSLLLLAFNIGSYYFFFVFLRSC